MNKIMREKERKKERKEERKNQTNRQKEKRMEKIKVCSSSSQVVKKYRSTADCGKTGENQSKGAAETKRDRKRGED